MTTEALALLVSAGTIAALLWINGRWLPLLPDDPPSGGRKCHAHPMPMVGVALGALSAAALLVFGSPQLAAGAILCTVVGFLDDRGKARSTGLPVAVKTVALASAAGLAAFALPGSAMEGSSLPPATLLVVVALAFVVINAINFLDNTDGVAAAVGGVGLLLATDGQGELAVLGYLFLGFLPFNWPRPRALLGDAGALSLGYCLAVTALARGLDQAAVNWPALLAPVAVPVLDFFQVVSARLWLGFAPWIGDRRHLTHLAMNSGLPHVLVAPLFAGLVAGLYVVLA